MKNKALPLFLFFLSASLFSAASILPDTIPVHRKNTSYISLLNGRSLNGYIIAVSDSTVSFLNRSDYFRRNYSNQQLIPAEGIQEVKKRHRKGVTTGGGILTGLLGGAIIGFGLGLTYDCDDPDGKCDFIDRLFSTRSFKASLILSGVLGTVGGLIGLFSPKKSKVSFSINGKRENLRDNKNGILFY